MALRWPTRNKTVRRLSALICVKISNALREEFGWEDLVATVAKIRDSLPLQDRGRLGPLAGNYSDI